MRLNYRIMPTDYIEELQRSGRRMKARCFMEYFFDYQMGEVNSIGFYAKSWGDDRPMSKGTVHKWIKEFVYEIERFWSYHQLKNQQHYRSVKNQSERQVNGKRTKDTPQEPKKSHSKNQARTASERQVNEALNIYDDDNARGGLLRRRYFDDLYMIYRLNTKFAGKKEDAWSAYKQMEDIDQIDHKAMIRSVVLYLHDKSIEKKYNLTNYLRNQIYLNYIDTRMTVLVDGEWITGKYDDDREVFTSESGQEYRLTPAKLADKLAAGDLRFIIGSAA